jgi:hypothetical protein
VYGAIPSIDSMNTDISSGLYACIQPHSTQQYTQSKGTEYTEFLAPASSTSYFTMSSVFRAAIGNGKDPHDVASAHAARAAAAALCSSPLPSHISGTASARAATAAALAAAKRGGSKRKQVDAGGDGGGSTDGEAEDGKVHTLFLPCILYTATALRLHPLSLSLFGSYDDKTAVWHMLSGSEKTEAWAQLVCNYYHCNTSYKRTWLPLRGAMRDQRCHLGVSGMVNYSISVFLFVLVSLYRQYIPELQPDVEDTESDNDDDGGDNDNANSNKKQKKTKHVVVVHSDSDETRASKLLAAKGSSSAPDWMRRVCRLPRTARCRAWASMPRLKSAPKISQPEG